ncbi:restriction endonuclease subunit S [Micromonospora profundi]|uniref:restriction endonuclease subunit S n=1 Tax=Micromonospora profundi TaxID=1420889 RepID=UPI0033B21140
MTATFALDALLPGGVPHSWSYVPLWTLVRRLDVTNRPDAELLSVYRDHGVVPKSSRDDNFNKASEDLTEYRYVRPGDLVLNKMKTWQGSLAVSDYEGIVSPAYIVCEVTAGVHRRYLHYLLRSQPYVHMYQALSKGIRPNQWDLPFDEFRKIPVILPPIQEQRRIADFLDAETARIDRLAAARLRQRVLLSERWQTWLAEAISNAVRACGELPLRRVCVGLEQGWSPQCDDAEALPEEWAVLKTSAVSSGRFDALAHKLLPTATAPDTRYKVDDGDLLLTRGSGSADLVGMAAVAQTEGRKLLLSDLLYRVKLARDWSSSFVALVLRSQYGRQQITSTIRGAAGLTVKIRGEDILGLRIPQIPPSEQAAFTDSLERAESELFQLSTVIDQSNVLLAERRQALITAAVTGQFDVTTAREADLS